MKGCIALDIDGTLTNELHSIDPQVVASLEKLSNEGWQIALLTGRIFSFAWQILRAFHFPYLLAVQNGADILQMPQKKLLRRNYFSYRIISEIEEAYIGQKEDFIIYAGIEKGDFCYFRQKRFSEKMLHYLAILQEVCAAPWQVSDFVFEKGMSFPLIKCFGEEKSMLTLNQLLKENPNIEVSMIRDPIDKSLFLNLITHPQANKGSCVRFFKELLNPPCVIAAGDDRNDLSMFQEANISIAIEHAPEEVRSAANIIAKEPEELGIIHALEQCLHQL